MRSILEHLHKYEGHPVKPVEPPEVPYTVDGVTIALSAAAQLAIRINDRVLMEWYSAGDDSPPYGVHISANRVHLCSTKPLWPRRGDALAWAEKLVNRIRD